MRAVGGAEVQVVPKGSEAGRVGAIGAPDPVCIDVLHQLGGGAVGAPKFLAMRAVDGAEVQVVPKSGESVRV